MKKIVCKDYCIHIDKWDSLRNYLGERTYSQIFVLVDEVTVKLCLPILKSEVQADFTIIQVKSGEAQKDLHTCEYIWAELTHHGADRHSLLINLGGGVIGDMGGFAAATYMRGMHFIQIPTTLLSQVDASIGGKLGVDFRNYKNMIGIIKNPGAVFVFSELLQSLPYKQLLSGFAEVLKHGLIANRTVFDRLSQITNLQSVDWTPIVQESIMIKQGVTEQDPEERGLRKILNFGHTIGHAIESINLESKDPLLHGEAIAIGMIIESHISYSKGFIPLAECAYIKNVLISLYGQHPSKVPSLEHLKKLMQKDKKNKGGNILFSLLAEVGTGNYDQSATDEQIAAAVAYYISKQ